MSRALLFVALVAILAIGYSKECHCVFKPPTAGGVGVPDSAKVGALDYVCGVMSCAPIQWGGKYSEPNTLEYRASWAIDAYFQKHISDMHSCDFNGIAKVACDCQCQLNPAVNTTKDELNDIIDTVCNQIDSDCSPIQEGGSHFEPNEPKAHAAWAIDYWYHLFPWSKEACGFNGAALLTPEIKCRRG
eukprot:TRINITY_DN2_c0_g1_i1.p1 TRINITY_DN2_c0_g1~~TRINITY_DN2_c0_g1_i1.p1  ORF type:complete len:188 (-),score=34.57 TRINITY_DN2_c0_g1_i1:114-677(-)